MSNETYVPRQLDARLGKLETRFDGHIDDFDELRKLVIELNAQFRELEKWRLEVAIYVRQIRWLMVLVFSALITGIVNIVLNLELHAPG